MEISIERNQWSGFGNRGSETDSGVGLLISYSLLAIPYSLFFSCATVLLASRCDAIACSQNRVLAQKLCNCAGADLNDLVFFFARSEHEGFDSFSWILAFVEDQLHLLGDGHLDFVLAGEAER